MTLLIVILCAAACDAGPTHPSPSAQTPPDGDNRVRFPVQKAIENRTSAASLVVGDLIEAGGCLRVISHPQDTGLLVLWPPGFNLRAENGRIEILDPESRVVARVGEPVYVDGGELAADVDRKWLSGLLEEPLPAQCAGPYWIGGTEVWFHPPTPSPFH